ncbi:Lethal(2)neighbour of Tid protein [Eremomyces bilateralis CBS 781.70]|uniref:Dol-P-Man:Man(5)GlcNAc(2)-PP-Dol alpha-1,3-mannosyltransferase n=1 Tax=Eremomyces bilateralis CBS 781.70 TaxID=1392243 RepID=A0A6G1G888_9PEZI|nr:Lethal(2)neighbour of Tid protein [Eremomyces bilateralis CBS 781.70]KAF1814141.1 Lethal(2)neighbour of Tid protein [Eremomyces bilateralis CBS 781.70]
MDNPLGLIKDLLTNPRHSRWIASLLILADAVLCVAVILYVPYTEIDWDAYMSQVSQFVAGERQYANIKGGTGPLVYPAMHVYIYRALYAVTDKGRNIRTAQWIFAGVYLATLALVMAVYRKAKAPPYLLGLLVLSKRVHSIFLLRLFNDSFVAFFLWATIYFYQRQFFTVGSFFYSLGVGVKMSMLLPLPAIGIVLLQALGRERAITQALVMAQIQVAIGYPFLVKHTPQYFERAFDLGRQFLYKWTVNFRFVSEEVFLSQIFSSALLGAHAWILSVFATTRWLAPLRTVSGSSVPTTSASGGSGSARHESRKAISSFKALQIALLDPYASEGSSGPVPSMASDLVSAASATFIPTAILTANAVGMLCARSLHYQFYAWGYWGTPFLLWRAGFPPIGIIAVWAAQEVAWNIFPSTPVSSAVVVACLAAQVGGVWWGTRKDFFETRREKKVHGE